MRHWHIPVQICAQQDVDLIDVLVGAPGLEPGTR